MTLAERLTGFAARLEFDDIPTDVVASVRLRTLDILTYAKDRISDERTLALAARVQHTVDPASRFPDGFPGWVRVRLRDGRLVEAREPDGRGSAARPLEPGAIVAKFHDNARRALPADRVAALEKLALSVDSLDTVGTLLAACRV